MLDNHGARIGATETALLVDAISGCARAPIGEPRELLPLVERLAAQAAESRPGQRDRAARRRSRYQAVLVPVKAPVLVGWVLMGFPLDQQLATDMKQPVGARPDADLAPARARALDGEPDQPRRRARRQPRRPALERRRLDDAAMTSVGVLGEEIGVRDTMLRLGHEGDGGASARALVSLSVDDAVRATARPAARAARHHPARHRRLRARQRVHGAARHDAAARRSPMPPNGSARGDYATPMTRLQRRDEIGDLAQSFERMRHSIAANAGADPASWRTGTR